MRDMNRNSVFRYIASQHEVSRPMIAQATGISSPTVLKIVNFLIEEELAVEHGERSGTVGRKPQMLRFNKDRYFAIGAVLEGVYLRAGIVNLAGEVVCSASVEAEGELGEIMTKGVPSLVDHMVEKSGIARDRLLGIGLGLPCSYDRERHIANFAPLIGVNHSLVRAGSGAGAFAARWHAVDCGQRRQHGRAWRIQRARPQGPGLCVCLDRDRTGAQASSWTASCATAPARSAGRSGTWPLKTTTSPASTTPRGWKKSINLGALKQRFGFTLNETSKAVVERVAEYLASYVALCITNFAAIIDCGTVCLGGILPEKLGDALYKRVREQLDIICAIKIDLQEPIVQDAGIVGGSLLIIERELERILGK